MTSPIPTRARQVVRERDGGHCLRCGAGAYIEYHHRRRRGVGDDPHAPCNGVSLCLVCHKWVHAHPEDARVDGFIVSMYEDFPAEVPVRSFMGMIALSCDGGIDLV